jgi:hypothetical protein
MVSVLDRMLGLVGQGENHSNSRSYRADLQRSINAPNAEDKYSS